MWEIFPPRISVYTSVYFDISYKHVNEFISKQFIKRYFDSNFSINLKYFHENTTIFSEHMVLVGILTVKIIVHFCDYRKKIGFQRSEYTSNKPVNGEKEYIYDSISDLTFSVRVNRLSKSSTKLPCQNEALGKQNAYQ